MNKFGVRKLLFLYIYVQQLKMFAGFYEAAVSFIALYISWSSDFCYRTMGIKSNNLFYPEVRLFKHIGQEIFSVLNKKKHCVQ